MQAVVAVAALTQALLPAPEAPPAWWYVGHSTQATVFFIDVERLVKRGRTVSFWEFSAKKGSEGSPPATLKQVEVACPSREVRVLASHAPGARSPMLAANDTPFRSITPGSMGEVVASFACAHPAQRRALGAFPIGVSPEAAARFIQGALAGPAEAAAPSRQ